MCADHPITMATHIVLAQFAPCYMDHNSCLTAIVHMVVCRPEYLLHEFMRQSFTRIRDAAADSVSPAAAAAAPACAIILGSRL